MRQGRRRPTAGPPGDLLRWLVTLDCVVWYSTVTIAVAIGDADIKEML
ncbi:MAG: hypothetical protein ABFC96_18185 [Thermoguttaceae bacterium]